MKIFAMILAFGALVGSVSSAQMAEPLPAPVGAGPVLPTAPPAEVQAAQAATVQPAADLHHAPVVVLAAWEGPMPQLRRAPAVLDAVARPMARSIVIPDARWDHRPGGRSWTMAGLRAMSTHGRRIDKVVPRDIHQWCPGYPNATTAERRAFWIGLLSALSFHESTWNPNAEGGGGQWIGLLQIYPQTARWFKCNATTVAELKNGRANVACAVRIMNTTIPRDQAVAIKDGRWKGLAADWGPMRNPRRVAQMQRWTRAQPYCKAQMRSVMRPAARPAAEEAAAD